MESPLEEFQPKDRAPELLEKYFFLFSFSPQKTKSNTFSLRNEQSGDKLIIKGCFSFPVTVTAQCKILLGYLRRKHGTAFQQ